MTAVVSLNITENCLLADFVQQLKNDACFHAVRLDKERARANAIVKILKIARLLYFPFQ